MKQSPPQGSEHIHGPGCGHTALRNGHTLNYLDKGQLYEVTSEDVVQRALEVTEDNPGDCRPIPETFVVGHRHGPGCGHPAVPHGDHTDYIVDGRLHHPHGDHCDDHGPVDILDNE